MVAIVTSRSRPNDRAPRWPYTLNLDDPITQGIFFAPVHEAGVSYTAAIARTVLNYADIGPHGYPVLASTNTTSEITWSPFDDTGGRAWRMQRTTLPPNNGGSYAQFPAAAFASAVSKGEFSYASWMKSDYGSSESWGPFAFCPAGYTMRYPNGSGNLVLPTLGAYNFSVTAANLNGALDKWHHLAVSAHSAGEAIAYQYGTHMATEATVASFSQPDDGRIGIYATSSARTYHGAFYGLLLWDRIITADEVAQLADPATRFRHLYELGRKRIFFLAADTNITISPTEGAASLTGETPSVALAGDVTRSPTEGAATLTGETPSVALALDALPSEAALAVTGETPSVALALVALPSEAALALATDAPTVVLRLERSPSEAALSLASETPSVQIAAEGAVNVPEGALTIATDTPTVVLSLVSAPSEVALTLSGETPSVSLEADLQPTVASLSISAETPTIALRIERAPTAGSLSFLAEIPAVENTGDPEPVVLPATGGVGRRKYQRRVLRDGRVYVARSPAEYLKLLEQVEEAVEQELVSAEPEYVPKLKRRLKVIRGRIEEAKTDEREQHMQRLRQMDDEILSIWALLN